MVLRPGALSLWDTIPDAVLEPVTVKQNVSDDAVLWPMLWAMCSVGLFATTSDHRASWPLAGVISAVGLLLMIWLLVRFAPVIHYMMDSDGVHILGRKPREIPWISFTRFARWSTLYVVTGFVEDTRIRFIAPIRSDESSKRAQLAWIRHMRDHGTAMPIPDSLRRFTSPVAVVPDEVNIRLQRAYAWLPVLFFGILMLVVCVMPRIKPWGLDDSLMMLFTGLGAAVPSLAAAKYHVHADQSGLRKTTIFGIQNVAWSEVSSYKRLPGLYSPAGLELKDARGRVLGLSALTSSTGLQWDMLTSMIDARLAHLLPRPEEQPDYLSCPFDFEATNDRL